MTATEVVAAIGHCAQYRATGELATVERVRNGAVLIAYDTGGTHWVAPESLNRRADMDGRPIRRQRRAS